jgi:uncharacterized protein (TIGR03437 family)
MGNIVCIGNVECALSLSAIECGFLVHWRWLVERALCSVAPIAIILLGLTPSVGSAQGTIRTLVGRDWVFPTNVGTARNAPLGRVGQIVVDRSGNVFVADADNEMVFRISPAGALVVIAGSGIPGFSGDDGPAINASLNAPSGVAVDDAGNVYIADSRNHCVRQVGVNGIIRTIAGTGTPGYSGDNGPGISALLKTPTGLAIDASGHNLYILDYENVVVRRLQLNLGGLITTFAGNTKIGFAGDGGPATNASFNNLGGLTVDNNGFLLIADSNNNRIRRVGTNNIISTLVGNGDGSFSTADTPALSTPINGPAGLAVASDGTLYFTDGSNLRVRKLTPAGIVTTVAGTGDVGKQDGPSLQASFSGPFGLALDGLNNLYIGDSGNRLVRKLAAGLVSTFGGSGQYRPLVEGAPASTAFLFNPTHATTDSQGNLYIADTDNARVLKVSPNGSTTTVAGTTTDGRRVNLPCTPSDYVLFPSGVALDANGNLYLADFAPNVVYKITPDTRICRFAGGGTALGENGPAINASLGSVLDIAFDSKGNLFIADAGNSRIRRVAPDGTISTFAGNGQAAFSGDNGRATDASLNRPYGLSVDTSGNVYIADRFNNRIRKVTPNCLVGSGDCIITTVAGNGSPSFSGDGGLATTAAISSPWGVAVDRDGNLLIADSDNNRVRKVTAPGPNGIITTVAGTGTRGFFGDGGPASSAFLNEPTGVTTQRDGTVLIVDQGNNRVRTFPTAPAAANCTATSLNVVFASAVTVSASFPSAIDVLVVDDCGVLITTANVVVTFSNGDPPIALQSLNNGHWAGTWAPKNTAQTVTLSARATTIFGALTGTATITASSNTTSNPVIGGVLDPASYVARPLSPGSFIAIFGAHLADSTASATALPLPTLLGCASVSAGGILIPLLFVSPSQINAVLPYSIPINSTIQILVQRCGLPSTPMSAIVAASNPAIFTTAQNGKGQGIIVYPDGTLNGPSLPAPVDHIVTIYCQGLGATSPAVTAGQAAPVSSPLAVTSNPVTITIGGVPSPVLFAGLTPGFAGLYQVNTQIPSGAPAGDQVPVVLTVAGQSSPPVTIAIR